MLSPNHLPLLLTAGVMAFAAPAAAAPAETTPPPEVLASVTAEPPPPRTWTVLFDKNISELSTEAEAQMDAAAAYASSVYSGHAIITARAGRTKLAELRAHAVERGLQEGGLGPRWITSTAQRGPGRSVVVEVRFDR